MKIHEYQTKEILRRYGIPIPNRSVTEIAEEAEGLLKKLEVKEVKDNDKSSCRRFNDCLSIQRYSKNIIISITYFQSFIFFLIYVILIFRIQKEGG